MLVFISSPPSCALIRVTSNCAPRARDSDSGADAGHAGRVSRLWGLVGVVGLAALWSSSFHKKARTAGPPRARRQILRSLDELRGADHRHGPGGPTHTGTLAQLTQTAHREPDTRRRGKHLSADAGIASQSKKDTGLLWARRSVQNSKKRHHTHTVELWGYNGVNSR